MENKFNSINLDDLIAGKAPEDWDFSYNLTFCDVFQILTKIHEKNLAESCIIEAMQLLSNNKEGLEKIAKKPSNFTRKITKKASENIIPSKKEVNIHSPVPELIQKSSFTEADKSSNSIGPYCDKLLFFLNVLCNYVSFSGPQFFDFNNGSIYELYQHIILGSGETWDYFSNLLAKFTGKNKLSAQCLQGKVTSMLTKRSTLLKSRSADRVKLLDDFLNLLFSYEAIVKTSRQKWDANNTKC